MLTASSTAKRPKEPARFEPSGRDHASPTARQTPSAEPSILATPPPAVDESAPPGPDTPELTPAMDAAIRRVVAESFARLENTLFARLRRGGALAKGEPKGETRPSAAQLEAELQRVRDEHARDLAQLQAEHEREKSTLVKQVALETAALVRGEGRK